MEKFMFNSKGVFNTCSPIEIHNINLLLILKCFSFISDLIIAPIKIEKIKNEKPKISNYHLYSSLQTVYKSTRRGKIDSQGVVQLGGLVPGCH